VSVLSSFAAPPQASAATWSWWERAANTATSVLSLAGRTADRSREHTLLATLF
jgi:hypothetical protein